MYIVELERTPIGFSLDTVDKGETTSYVSSAFMSDIDGNLFYEVLENITSLFLRQYLDAGKPISKIDHLLVLIKDNKASVYINELAIIREGIAQRQIKAGERVSLLEDVLGISKVYFQDLPIPDDVSIIFYFSVGWRRGLFFDLRPVSGTKLQDIHSVLGTYYEYLTYYDLHNVETETQKNLYSLGWFPFTALIGKKQKYLQRLLSRIKDAKSIHNAEAKLIEAIDDADLNQIVERLRQNSALIPHLPILEAGIERYREHDYISSINNIWPRLEGILRYAYSLPSERGIQRLLNNMDTSLDKARTLYPGVFFPKQFKDYLTSFYFQDFDLFAGELQISRNSIAHGVAPSNDYDRKRALIGILIADQLAQYVRFAPASIETLRGRDHASDNLETDEEIRELVTNLGQHPASGAEIVAEGLTGAWADQGIEDSVAWLNELRRKRRDKFR